MKLGKKLTAVLGALALTATLSGCEILGAQASPAPTPAVDLTQELAGIPRDTVVFTVNGVAVTAEEYLFWLAQTVNYMDQYAQYLGEAGINWEEDMSGVSMAEYCKNDAMEIAKLHALLNLRAQQEGCAFGEAEEAQLRTDLDNMITELGGQEQYALWLSRNGLSEEGFKLLNMASYNYTNLQEALYGAGASSAPTDEVMDDYIAENDILSAKHILLLTVDMANYDSATNTYASLSEEEVAAKKTKAEGLLAQLRASDDPAALFDQLMNENSEDSGLSSNPDGYVFTAGEMQPEFETATRALEYGQISDPVKTVYGYHIILRLDPDNQALRDQYVSDQMDALLDALVTDAKVETTAEYDALNPQDYYTKLKAHQTEVDEQIAALQSPSPEPTVTNSAGS